MIEVKVPFAKYDREQDCDKSIIDAIRLGKDSTSHEVTYDVIKYDSVERTGWRKRKTYRTTELHLKIRTEVGD